jgi:two-component system invasion response regulator UvrY
MEQISIVIVDDHTLVRETWSLILSCNPSFSVVGGAGSAEEGLEMIERLHPSVVIMDINLPGLNGIEATGKVRQCSPETKVLGVSLHTQPTYAKKIMREGASGYVTKNSSREEMFKAITEIMQGKKYICQEIKNILSEQMLGSQQAAGEPGELTDRELQIISCIKKGHSSKQIAETLAIAVKTVEVHRHNILKKLKLKNSAALVNYIHMHDVEKVSN